MASPLRGGGAVTSVVFVVRWGCGRREMLVMSRSGGVCEVFLGVRYGGVQVDEETLFRTSISLPAALTEGEYAAEIYLTRGGKIVDVYVTTIPVVKVGLERWLYNLSREMPLIYGLMSLAIAIFAGWGAAAIFQVARLR